jgi:tetratricopeptide (TPR) repeat protein
MEFKTIEEFSNKYKTLINYTIDNKDVNDKILDIYNGKISENELEPNYYHIYADYLQYVKKDYELMKKYYLKSLEAVPDKVYVYTKLGYYYEITEKDYDLMMKYYLLGVKNKCTLAMSSLGLYYQRNKQYDLMKYYYFMALDLEQVNAVFYNLGLYYSYVENKYDLAIKYYLKALNNNSNNIKIFEHYEKLLLNNKVECAIILANIPVNNLIYYNLYRKVYTFRELKVIFRDSIKIIKTKEEELVGVYNIDKKRE